MRKSGHGFKKALEQLEKLKKISYGSPAMVSPLHQDRKEENPICEMKDALKNIGGYFKKAATSPKKQADKALKESNFLISGVQNVFSFLENRERRLYQSLVHDYSELSKTYSKTQENLSHKITSESEEEVIDEVESPEEERFLNNLVEVKKDRCYELFYISDEDNKRFYTETLSQIIYKQGKLHEASHEGDPLTKTIVWRSEETQKVSSSLIFTNDAPIRIFYETALSHFHLPFVEKIHNAVMALFCSRYPTTLVSNSPKKDNTRYFNDFLLFLREAWLALSTDPQETVCRSSQVLISALSLGIFESKRVFTEAARYLYFHITTKLEAEGKKALSTGQYITEAYETLYRLFAKYPNGPLFKAIDILLETGTTSFDPFMLGMLPSHEGTLTWGEKTIRVIRSPSPVHQNSIVYATCNEEFTGFLKTKAELGEMTLVLNIQNRLTRKDRARSHIIEATIERVSNAYVFSFPEPEELLKSLEEHYGEQETFSTFLSSLQKEFTVGSSLFLIPQLSLKGMEEFIAQSFPKLKDVFFSKKKILFRNDKLLLLHTISYLLVFKLIEILNPDNLVVMSKDGLDYASVFIAGFAFFSQDDFWDEHKLKLAMTKILSPTLVARDRLVFTHHMELLSKFVNCLRKNRAHLGALQPLFSYDPQKWELTGYLEEITEVSDTHNS